MGLFELQIVQGFSDLKQGPVQGKFSSRRQRLFHRHSCSPLMSSHRMRNKLHHVDQLSAVHRTQSLRSCGRSCMTVYAFAVPGVSRGTSKWRIRDLEPQELMAAAEIQFEGFHRPNSFQLVDALSRMTFRAEVVSTLKQKLQYNTPDSFACFVAERASSGSGSATSTVVGVGDVSLQSDKEVLSRLPEHCEQYAYLSSMAVAPSMRRQGIAQALLAAATKFAVSWKQKYLVLHFYADNVAAERLYNRAGFREAGRVTPFMGRTRVLMVKRLR